MDQRHDRKGVLASLEQQEGIMERQEARLEKIEASLPVL